VKSSWYAVRELPIPDTDERGIESVLIWVERREDSAWAVGRADDVAQREFAAPRPSDFVFEGFELDDALQAANDVLEDEWQAAELDGMHPDVKPITRREVEEPLNEWFWGRRER
jgi:hypothetical protein